LKEYAVKYPDAPIAMINPRSGTKDANEIIKESTPPMTSIYLPIPLNGNVNASCIITSAHLYSTVVKVAYF
jgi:hypothetical protein